MLRLRTKPHKGGTKDGRFDMSLAMPERMVRVERLAGSRFARPQPVAAMGRKSASLAMRLGVGITFVGGIESDF